MNSNSAGSMTPGIKDVLKSRRPVLGGKVNFPLTLAPMVGLSHSALRAVLRSYLPEGAFTLWPTEMLSSRRLPNEKVGETPETHRYAGETGLTPQILGNEESFIAASVKKLEDWGAEAIDINMGCPVQKALKHNYGVALMGDPQYAANVVAMTVKHAHVPVSVKLRAGHQNDFSYLVDFAKGLETAGASWLCLHPRTAAQKRRGSADWNQIRDLRSRLSIPLIGNGDVQTADDVFLMLEETECDLVMSGRALAARPWMLWQVGERLGFGPPTGRQGSAPQTPEQEGAEYGRALLKLCEGLESLYPVSLGLRKLAFYVRHTGVWLVYGHSLYSRVTQGQDWSSTRALIEEFFSQPQPMMARTDLRE